MRHLDTKDQSTEIEKTKQKFAGLMPSIQVSLKKVNRALVLIGGTIRSQTAILLSEKFNKKYGSKIDYVLFYSEDIIENAGFSKERYENSLNYIKEKLNSDDFNIKAQDISTIEGLIDVINTLLRSNTYDLLIVSTSFIGLREKQKEEEEEESHVQLMGNLFEYLLEKTEVPLLLVESETIDTEHLWKDATILVPNYRFLSTAVEKALYCTQKDASINIIININPQLFPDERDRTLEEFLKTEKEEIEKFERANVEVFKDLSRKVEFNLYSFSEIEQLRECLNNFGKDTGLILIFLRSKHSLLYGLFTEILEHREIFAPLFIIKNEEKKELTSETEECKDRSKT